MLYMCAERTAFSVVPRTWERTAGDGTLGLAITKIVR
jgi:hypothetical protein